MQTTPSTVRYADLDLYFANVWMLARRSFVPVVLHLDHGDSFALAMQAIRAGYTSVMFDGSAKAFEENIEMTKLVVEVAQASGTESFKLQDLNNRLPQIKIVKIY